jgi:hypothetical protein
VRWRRESPSRKASVYVRLRRDRRPGEQSPYLGDGAAVAVAAGVFCVVEVLLPIFFDRLRTFAPFLHWVFGITIIPSVMVCSYGVERRSGPGNSVPRRKGIWKWGPFRKASNPRWESDRRSIEVSATGPRARLDLRYLAIAQLP